MASREDDFSMSDAPREPTQAEHIADLRRLHRECIDQKRFTTIWFGAPMIASVLAMLDELEAALAMKTSYEAQLTADDRMVPLYFVRHPDGSFSPAAPQPVAADAHESLLADLDHITKCFEDARNEWMNCREELAALRAQEPVAYHVTLHGADRGVVLAHSGLRFCTDKKYQPLYAAPAPAAVTDTLVGTLLKFNAWRKGEIHEWNVGASGPDPQEITKAIDTACALLSAATAPASVPDAVADLIPPGWVLYSVDASIQSSNPLRPMSVMLKRDVSGVQWWLQLTEIEKEETQLYLSGKGMTLTTAIQNAVSAMLASTSATQEGKP